MKKTSISTIFPRAPFDSESEKGRVAALLAGHNQDQSLAPEEDATFGVIARERTARHPLRTYLWVPFQRVLTIWFTPRIELLPYSGNVFPLKQNWEDDRQDQAVTVSFFFLNVFYLGLACAGAWKLWTGISALAPRFWPLPSIWFCELCSSQPSKLRTSLRSSLFPCDSSVGSRRVHPPAQIGSYSSLVSAAKLHLSSAGSG